MKRAFRRLNLKVRYLVDDLHRYYAKWPGESYNSILLPNFQTSTVIRRGLRRNGSKTVRAICTWSEGARLPSTSTLTVPWMSREGGGRRRGACPPHTLPLSATPSP
jgi:hypothetical protein